MCCSRCLFGWQGFHFEFSLLLLLFLKLLCWCLFEIALILPGHKHIALLPTPKLGVLTMRTCPLVSKVSSWTVTEAAAQREIFLLRFPIWESQKVAHIWGHLARLHLSAHSVLAPYLTRTKRLKKNSSFTFGNVHTETVEASSSFLEGESAWSWNRERERENWSRKTITLDNKKRRKNRMPNRIAIAGGELEQRLKAVSLEWPQNLS